MNLTELRRCVDFWMAQANIHPHRLFPQSYGPEWEALVDGAVGAICRLMEEEG